MDRTLALVLLMVVVKVPLLGVLLWIAFRERMPARAAGGDGAAGEDDDGGGGQRRRHPRTPFPHLPRRGPHGDRRAAAPRRVRNVIGARVAARHALAERRPERA